jgi:hypothetical protein
MAACWARTAAESTADMAGGGRREGNCAGASERASERGRRRVSDQRDTSQCSSGTQHSNTTHRTDRPSADKQQNAATQSAVKEKTKTSLVHVQKQQQQRDAKRRETEKEWPCGHEQNDLDNSCVFSFNQCFFQPVEVYLLLFLFIFLVS